MSSYLSHCLPKSTENIRDVNYQELIAPVVTDKSKQQQIVILLGELFSEAITSMVTDVQENAIHVKIVHAPNVKTLSNENTVLYVPNEVHFTITKKGSLLFKEPAYAPYEQWNLPYPRKFYYVWDGVDVIQENYVISCNPSFGFFFSIAKLERVIREIKIQNFHL